MSKPSEKNQPSRRDFLQAATLGGGALGSATVLGAAVTAEASPQELACPPSFDFTKDSGALQPDRIVRSACQFCNCNCALQVHIKSGRVIDIKGATDDPVQAGGLCIKAGMMTELLYNRFRLTQPLKRTGGRKGDPASTFSPVTWDEALRTIAQQFLTLRDAGEARSIANKTSGRMARGCGSVIGRFFALLGSPNDTDVGPVCNDAGGNALQTTFGLGNFTNGYGLDGATGKEDLGSARLFLFFGTNQAETHPVTFSYLLRSRQRTGAKLVVIDPRLTPTGAQANEWIAPKPHTDLALVLGMLYHIVEGRLYDQAFVRRWVVGFAELQKHLLDKGYTVDWAAGVSGIPATKIRWLAETYARTRPAAIFCNAGISHQLSAFQTYRALTFLAAITGNIGVHGGGCNFMHNTWPGGLNLPAISGTPPVRGEALPVGPDAFADAILAKTPYPLRAIVSTGNPLLASANSERVKAAYGQLDFYVFTGLFMEESAYYADVILPVCSGLELETVYMRRDDRAIRWQKQAAPRVGQSRPDWEFWVDLAHAMAALDKKRPPSYWTANFPLEWKDYSKLWATFVANTPGMGGMTQARMEKRSEPLRWPCPTLDHPGVSVLYLDHPSWYAAAAALKGLPPGSPVNRFPTPSGKVELYTAELEKQLGTIGQSALPVFYTHPEVTGRNPTIEYTSTLVRNPLNPQAVTPVVKIGKLSDGGVHKLFPLMGMIGRPSVVHFSSVTQWTQTGKQKNGVRLIQIHPRTAAAAGIANGDNISVESPRGAVTGTAELWDGIREDTIYVPNSFGPAQKEAQELGTPLYAAANTLTDDRYFDNVSGQQAYKCFACRIRKV